MARRSTIGENPLDAVMPENPLDTVVPDLTLVAKAGRLQADPDLLEIKDRLGQLEQVVAAVKTDVLVSKSAQIETARLVKEGAGLKGEVAQLKSTLQRLETELPRVAADLSQLRSELTQIKEELAQLKAAQAAPSDVPWWMGGRRQR